MSTLRRGVRHETGKREAPNQLKPSSGKGHKSVRDAGNEGDVLYDCLP